MNRFQVVESDHKEAWDRMAAATPTVHFRHSFDWGQFQAQGFWAVRRVGLFRAGELVAGVTCWQPSRKYGSWTCCLIPRGPVYHDAEVIPDLLAEVAKVCRGDGAVFVKMDPDLPLETILPAWVQAAGLRPAPRETISLGLARANETFRLDLTESEARLRMNLHHKTRQYIYRYQRDDAKIRPVSSQEDLRTFVALIQETAARRGFSAHGADYYHRLWDMLGGSNRSRRPSMIWLLAEHRGQAIAGRAAIRFGGGAWDLLAGSLPIERECRPNHGLLWALILWARESGALWYDFGGAGRPNHPQFGGVYQFKQGFGGRFIKFHPEMDLVLRPQVYRLWNLAVPAIRHALPWVVRWAERGRTPAGAEGQ